MSHAIKVRTSNSLIEDSFFSHINDVISERTPNVQRINHIGKAVFDHVAYRSMIIFAIVATTVTLPLDLITGLAGIIFSQKRADYAINKLVISPAQHIILAITTLAITALHLRIGAIFTKHLVATGVIPILIPVMVTFCCLPYIYRVAKRISESLSFNDFSILRSHPDSGILYERKWSFG